MSDYDNTNRGALFNNKKRTKDSHPAFTGKINVEGTEYWISGWGKTSKANEKYISLSVTKIEETSTGTSSMDDFDDDVPF